MREPIRWASAAAENAFVSSALSKTVAVSRRWATRVWLACISPICATTPSPVSRAIRRVETDNALEWKSSTACSSAAASPGSTAPEDWASCCRNSFFSSAVLASFSVSLAATASWKPRWIRSNCASSCGRRPNLGR